MKVLIILCLCVAYVASQVVVPALPEANVRATQEHLAAVAKATNDHFAAKAGALPAAAPYAHYGYAGLGYAGHHYANAHYNPYGYGYSFSS